MKRAIFALLILLPGCVHQNHMTNKQIVAAADFCQDQGYSAIQHRCPNCLKTSLVECTTVTIRNWSLDQ